MGTTSAHGSTARRPLREYPAALGGEQPPTNPDRAPKALSPTDPAAAWTTRGRHKVMFGYSLNYLIDNDHAVIVDVSGFEFIPAMRLPEGGEIVGGHELVLSVLRPCWEITGWRYLADLTLAYHILDSRGGHRRRHGLDAHGAPPRSAGAVLLKDIAAIEVAILLRREHLVNDCF